jgi:site-specific recombinase XerD
MNMNEAVRRLTEVVRRQHLALATERTYCAWLRRYCDFLKGLPLHLPSEHKLERFLTALAQKDVAASTQNQAFNAIIFFYKEALGTELKNVQALRARRPAHIRHAPTPEETWQLLKIVQSDAAFATSVAVRLLYGCGLRVSEERPRAVSGRGRASGGDPGWPGNSSSRRRRSPRVTDSPRPRPEARQ